MIRNFFDKMDLKMLQKILFVTFLLMPILELDYMIYGFLDQFHLPLPSTLFYYLWIPLLLILCFLVLDKKKKKTFTIAFMAGMLCLVYFAVHHLITRDLLEVLKVTEDYVYSLSHELSYFVTLMLPAFFLYGVVMINPSRKWLNVLVVCLCLLISVPIFLSNIFEFGKSTYVGYVQDNIFSWFTGGYDLYHPRELCAKFFFPEGNTIGIMMFALYILLLKVFIQSEKRWALFPLVVVHGLAMIMLGTRVATYGSFLSIGAVLALCAALFIFKKEKTDLKAVSALVLVMLAFLLIFPYSPSKVNQDLAAQDQFAHGQIDKSKADAIQAGSSHLKPGSLEYNQYYIDIYEGQELYRYLTFPDVYYTTIYPYKIDAKFYVDLVTTVPFEQRRDGRDFEKYFFDYKWKNLTPVQQLVGFSYSRFMNAGINLEQDFIVQKYQYGYLGFILCTAPWVVCLSAVILKALMTLKKSFNLDVLTMGLSSCAMLLSGYMSGHVMDEFITNLFLALLMGMLIKAVFSAEKDS